MTDLVVGAGAVGTLMAWGLATGGRDVAIVRRRMDGPPRRATVTVTDPAGRSASADVTEVSSPDDLAAAPDVIVFAVKAFDLAAAAASCAAWPEAPALTVLNGVGAEDIVADARPDAGLIAGSVMASVAKTGEGTVARLNRGGVALAPALGHVDSLIDDLLAAFAQAGLPTRRIADPAAMKWSKLIANLVGNASSAILDMSPAQIYGSPASFGVERRQLTEALAVMRRLGLRPVALPGANVPLLAFGIRFPAAIARPIMRRIIGGARGGKDPSLRLHASSGSGPSEVHWLNGAVARTADRLGLPAPVNRRLAELVDEVVADPDRRAWFKGRPDRLVEAVKAGTTTAAARSRA
jgi:2-dehydropantoate 2-reductase